MSIAELERPVVQAAESQSVAGGRSGSIPFSPRFRGFRSASALCGSSRVSCALRLIAARQAAEHSAEREMWATQPELADAGGGLAPRTPASNRFESAAVERRRFRRRRSSHLVRVLPCRDAAVDAEELDFALHESPWRGELTDLSMNGAAFILSQPLTSVTRIWLRLECRTREFAVIRSGRIVRAVPMSETAWIVTCRFDTCVPYSDVVQLAHD
ncbi:MAG: PilZ domain-containing protein [Planctomycetaceae bacterium]|nr:PilZ domain-containing protein [Planctomycetaceae bacterium]